MNQILVLILSGFIVWVFVCFISFDSLFMQVLYNFIISLFVPTIIIILFYHRTEEFIGSKDRIKFIFNKIRK